MLDDLGNKITQWQRDPADTHLTKLRLERRVVLPCTRLMVTGDPDYDVYEDIEGPTASPVTLINTGSTHNYVSQALVDELGLNILRREQARLPQLGGEPDKRMLDVAELFIHGTTVEDEHTDMQPIEAYVVDHLMDGPTDVVIPTRRACQALIQGDSYSASIVRRTPQLLLGIADCDFLGLRAREHTVPAGFTVFDSKVGPIIAGEGWVRLAANDNNSYESETSECGPDVREPYDYGSEPPSDMDDGEDSDEYGETSESEKEDNKRKQCEHCILYTYVFQTDSAHPPWMTVNIGRSNVSVEHHALSHTVHFDTSGLLNS